MKNIFYLLTIIFPLSAFSARPTQHASNLASISKECNSITISWTSGNGNARLVVAREDNPTNWSPVDNNIYLPTIFGVGTSYNGNYVVYNSTGSNSVKVTNLKPGHTYYFTIFEHDNNGSSTEYYTAGAPSVSEKTIDLGLNYDIIYHDSCEMHNRYTFINRSRSDIQGLKYTFHFNNSDLADSVVSDSVEHTYKNVSGLITTSISVNTNKPGCINTFSKSVKIYQKKVAVMDWANYHDTVQCLTNNLMYFRTKSLSNPLSGSYGYRWFTEYDTATFNFFKKTIPKAGRHKVSVELTTNISKGANMYPTNCKDTLVFYIRLIDDRLLSAFINDTVQEIHSNRFIFNVADSSQQDVIWYFGDGDLGGQYIDTHSYKDTGWYVVHLSSRTQTLRCAALRTFHIYVFDSTMIPKDTSHHNSINKLRGNQYTIYPNPSNGIFKVTASTPVQTIAVYSLAGVKVKEYQFNEHTGAYIVNAKDLESGIYILMVKSQLGIDRLVISISD